MELTPFTAVGLVVALVGFRLLDRGRRAIRDRRPDASRSAERTRPAATDLREHAWKWAIPVCLLLLLAAEGRSLASIGWRIESPAVALRQVGVGVAALVGLNVLSAPLWARLGDRGDSLATGLGAFAALSVPERLFVAVTAGATEETAFHGYAIERLLALTGSVPLAGGVSFVAFTLGHLGEGFALAALGVVGFAVLKKPLSKIGPGVDVDRVLEPLTFYGVRGVVRGATELFAVVDRGAVATARGALSAAGDPYGTIRGPLSGVVGGDDPLRDGSLRAGIATSVLLVLVVLAATLVGVL